MQKIAILGFVFFLVALVSCKERDSKSMDYPFGSGTIKNNQQEVEGENIVSMDRDVKMTSQAVIGFWESENTNNNNKIYLVFAIDTLSLKNASIKSHIKENYESILSASSKDFKIFYYHEYDTTGRLIRSNEGEWFASTGGVLYASSNSLHHWDSSFEIQILGSQKFKTSNNHFFKKIKPVLFARFGITEL